MYVVVIIHLDLQIIAAVTMQLARIINLERYLTIPKVEI